LILHPKKPFPSKYTQVTRQSFLFLNLLSTISNIQL